jgi:3-deoxy-D-manno-octulosonic-acid transferase
MFKFVYYIIRIIFFPFLKWFLPLTNQKAHLRISFEHKNSIDHASNSFKEIDCKADYAFEVSSEGEFQQVKPIILKVLSEGSLVEIIYCSDSVDKQCQDLFDNFPNTLRILRLPILSFNPFSRYNPIEWLTASSFFLCRYDFFPELIFYGRKKDVNFNLIAGTLKNSENKQKNICLRLYFKYVYHSFDKIIMATDKDKKNILEKFVISDEIVESYDFRPVQILKRLDSKLQNLREKFKYENEFFEYLNKYNFNKRIILGSYWYDEDLILHNDIGSLLANGYQVSIVPHQLGELDIDKTRKSILENNSSVIIYELNNQLSKAEIELLLINMLKVPGVLIINLKGILCELYSYFGHAYVAGGYRSSVHSLLEPFLAGSMVYCGPKVHRSTEYDLIVQSNPDRIKIIDDPTHLFVTILNSNLSSLTSIHSFESHYKGHFSPILNWLAIKSSWESNA